MYSQVIYLHPESSKTRELIAELGKRNEISNGEGFPHMVAQQVWHPKPLVITVTWFQDLAQFQEWSARNSQDAEYGASAQRIGALLSEAASIEMHETLERSEQSGDIGYILNARSFAASGKASELRKALQSSFSGLPAKGTVARVLQREIAPEEGANFSVAFGFENLGGLDEFMHDPALGVANADNGHLLNRPNRQRLYRVLLPAQAQ